MKTEPSEMMDENHASSAAAAASTQLDSIKQEIDMSPGNGAENGIEMGGQQQQNIKLEPNEMKPPPEKKMKM